MSPEVAILAERYALEQVVADGGMATVWRARDDVLARTVAVKILHPHLVEDEGFLERFRREALAAARLTHPNIVAIFDTGVEEGPEGPQHYIVMEFCSEGTLAGILADEGALSPDRVVDIGVSICSALDYAHRNEVIHRDMKPANVLIAADGSLKVADFGIAKAAFAGREITTTGALLGTVTYISPEQARGDEPDARSDVYCLGAVLYELLVGRPPFAGETALATAMKHLQEPAPPLRSIRAGIPREVEAVVMKALAKNPDERQQSAEELRRELLRSGGGGEGTVVMRSPVARQTQPSPPGTHHGDGRWIAQVSMLVAAVVLVAVAVAWVLGTDDNGPNDRSGSGNRGGAAIDVITADDFDPHGDESEHPDEVSFAFDGVEGTAWTTEGYNTALQDQKAGVGLVFDLGESVEVSAIELIATAGTSYEIRVADDPGATELDFEEVAQGSAAADASSVDVGGQEGRYWLVWITQLPGGGPGEAAVSEVTFRGP